MDLIEKQIARILFRNKIREAKGQQFEDFFSQILSYARADFRPVKPQGRVGDRKNDGFEPIIGRYYQVYAPEDSTAKESSAIKKIQTDFNGLKKHWASVYPAGIVEFYFVLNDKYYGAFPTTMVALQTLKDAHSLNKCDVLLCKHLEDIAFSELADDQLLIVVGSLPDPSRITKLDFDMLTEVVGHILSSDTSKALPGKLASPQFDDKIQFNCLKRAESYLRAASYMTSFIEDFFSKNSTFARQALRDSLNNLYLESMSAGYVDNLSEGLTKEDQMYFHILNKATPTGQGSMQTMHAVQAVIAYFFESCDVFEEPPKHVIT